MASKVVTVVDVEKAMMGESVLLSLGERRRMVMRVVGNVLRLTEVAGSSTLESEQPQGTGEATERLS